MVPADLVRAILLATIPMAWVAGWLSLPWLVAVAFLTGVAGIFFEIAGFAYVPDLVASAELPAANRAVQGSSTVSEVAGPGLAGLLVQALGPPLAIVADAASYVASAVGVLKGRARPASWPRLPPSRPTSARAKEPPTGWRQGLTILFTNVYLRALTIHAAAFNLAEQILVINLVLWAVQEQGVSPGAYGLALSAAGLGALVGTLTALRLADRLGFGRAFAASLLLSCFAPLALAAFTLDGRRAGGRDRGGPVRLGSRAGQRQCLLADPAADGHSQGAAGPLRRRVPADHVRVHPDRRCPGRSDRRGGRHPGWRGGGRGRPGPVRAAHVRPADPLLVGSGRAGSASESAGVSMSPDWREGLRTGATLALATAALAVSFGAYATLAGWSPAATIAMSAVGVLRVGPVCVHHRDGGRVGTGGRAGGRRAVEPALRSHGRRRGPQPEGWPSPPGSGGPGRRRRLLGRGPATRRDNQPADHAGCHLDAVARVGHRHCDRRPYRPLR